MPKKKGNGEGTIVRRKDGSWMAQVSIGRDATGKLKRVTYYGKTKGEVQDKLVNALADKSKGCFIEPHKITVAQWLDVWIEDYKRQTVREHTLFVQRLRC